MSFNFTIVTEFPLQEGTIEDICTDNESYSYKRISIKNSIVNGEIFRTNQLVCTISGTNQVDLTDIDEDIVKSIEKANYVYDLDAPKSCSDIDIKFLHELCCCIADATHGACYESQLDSIFYNSTKATSKRKSNANKKRDKFDLLTLTFVLRPNSLENMAPVLLDILNNLFPEALPKTLETRSIERKYKLTDNSDFIDQWNIEANCENQSFMHWGATNPVFGGGILYSGQGPLPAKMPQHYSQRHELWFEVNGSFVSNLADLWVSKIVNLFKTVSTEFEVIYSAGYVDRNYLATKGNSYLHVTSESESTRVTSMSWAGIPHITPWLTWFGKEYSELLSEAFDKPLYKIEKDNSGTFLQMGELPMNREQLKNSYPVIPRDLLIPSSKIPNFLH